jgi:hypothetical protein
MNGLMDNGLTDNFDTPTFKCQAIPCTRDTVNLRTFVLSRKAAKVRAFSLYTHITLDYVVKW